jgi:hypothetical protein
MRNERARLAATKVDRQIGLRQLQSAIEMKHALTLVVRLSLTDA